MDSIYSHKHQKESIQNSLSCVLYSVSVYLDSRKSRPDKGKRAFFARFHLTLDATADLDGLYLDLFDRLRLRFGHTDAENPVLVIGFDLVCVHFFR